MSIQHLVAVLLITTSTTASASDICKSAHEMMACCQMTIKSFDNQIDRKETDMSWECWKEMELAVEQGKYEKWLNICTPEGLTLEKPPYSIVTFLQNNPVFQTRSPRFVMLRLLEMKWPCKK